MGAGAMYDKFLEAKVRSYDRRMDTFAMVHIFRTCPPACAALIQGSLITRFGCSLAAA